SLHRDGTGCAQTAYPRAIARKAAPLLLLSSHCMLCANSPGPLSMSSSELGSLLFLLLLFISTAHLLGFLFVRLRQPRVIGEILAGVLLGPTLLGHLGRLHFSVGMLPALMARHSSVIDFVYQLGLLLLMF